MEDARDILIEIPHGSTVDYIWAWRRSEPLKSHAHIRQMIDDK